MKKSLKSYQIARGHENGLKIIQFNLINSQKFLSLSEKIVTLVLLIFLVHSVFANWCQNIGTDFLVTKLNAAQCCNANVEYRCI